jgi:hypothetical protein
MKVRLLGPYMWRIFIENRGAGQNCLLYYSFKSVKLDYRSEFIVIVRNYVPITVTESPLAVNCFFAFFRRGCQCVTGLKLNCLVI